MWFVIGSSGFVYLAVYFSFPMSKVLLSVRVTAINPNYCIACCQRLLNDNTMVVTRPLGLRLMAMYIAVAVGPKMMPPIAVVAQQTTMLHTALAVQQKTAPPIAMVVQQMPMLLIMPRTH
jgi:hypothetical protein